MEAARAALQLAHAPYSKSGCGCAFRTDRGIVKGASIENAAYPNSICAISAGLVTSLSLGVRHFTAVHVINGQGSEEPCGRCLEHLTEFVTPSTPIEIETNGKITQTTLGELLPSCTKRLWLSPFLTAAKPGSDITGKYDSFTIENCAEIATENSLTVDILQSLCFNCLESASGAYIPISSFPVGAALIAKNDPNRIIRAANVECAVLGNGLCAERSCIARASTSFPNKFEGIKCLAVCCIKLNDYGRPCGGCRQSLVEWGDFPVFQVMVDNEQKLIKIEVTTSFKLLPNCFSPASL